MTYYLMEMKRVLRDPVTLFFAAGLPAFMYLLFGANQVWGALPFGKGNAAMSTMIAMGAYGAVTATTGIGGGAAVERMQGWGRQLGLTPMTDRKFVTVKSAVALTVAAIPIVLTYVLGSFTLAAAPAWIWFAAAGITFVGATMFALYGLSFGLGFRSEAAVGAASGALVILGFLGNVFMPLSGTMLIIARFTPLYGLATLARYPMTEGQTINIETGEMSTEPLWAAVANVGVWTVVFALLALWLVRRGRERH